jgi:hypothetical protein
MCRPDPITIRNFIENKFVNRKLEKGGWSVPRAPVMNISISNP